MRWFAQLLPSPDRVSESKRRVAALIVVGALIFIPWCLSYLVMAIVAPHLTSSHLVAANGAGLVGTLGVIWAARSGRLGAAGVLGVLVASVIGALLLVAEGPSSPRVGLLLVVVMMAGFVTRPWVSAATGAAALALLGVLTLAVDAELLAAPGPPDSATVVMLRYILLAAIIGTLVATGFHRAIQQLERREQDLSERNRELAQSRGALSVTETRYGEIFDRSPEGLACIDSDGLLRDANPALLTLLGRERDAVLAHSMEALGLLDAAESAAPASTGGAGRERLVTRPDDTTVWLECIVRRLGASGEALLIVRNVDAHKRAQALEANLQQSQRLESIGRLAGGVAHDFNNLLTVIIGNADLLRRQGQAPPGVLREILTAAEQGSRVTRQLLAFGRQQPSEPVRVDLNEALRELRTMLERLIGEHIRFELALDTPEAVITADPTLVDQIVVNLVVNAQQAMPEGGVLTIGTDSVYVDTEAAAGRPGLRPGPYVELRVRDTGVGMTADVMERVFEPFFSTNDTADDAGLGLSTVHGVVRRLEGHIDVESTSGVGTEFRLLLPAASPACANPTAACRKRDATIVAPTVMVVDDEEAVRRVAGLTLRECGYDVILARDADEASDLAAAHPRPVDLLLSDVVLARGSGPDVAARLRHDNPAIKVCFMSGHPGGVLERHGIADASRFLAKPFTVDALEARVRALLAEADTALK